MTNLTLNLLLWEGGGSSEFDRILKVSFFVKSLYINNSFIHHLNNLDVSLKFSLVSSTDTKNLLSPLLMNSQISISI